MASSDFDAILREATLKRDSQRLEILSTGPSRDDLIAELQRAIRASKQALPSYRRVQEPVRYQMTVEDIEEHEHALAMFQTDLNVELDDEELLEALLNARATVDVINHVLQNGPGPHVTATQSASGCGVSIIIVLSLAAGIGAIGAILI